MSEKQQIKISGTIRSLRKTESRNKDVDKVQGSIKVMNEVGDTVSLLAGPEILDGFNPDDNVTIVIKREQQTLDESTKE